MERLNILTSRLFDGETETWGFACFSSGIHALICSTRKEWVMDCYMIFHRGWHFVGQKVMGLPSLFL
jgi:hypothetical protein